MAPLRARFINLQSACKDGDMYALTAMAFEAENRVRESQLS